MKLASSISKMELSLRLIFPKLYLWCLIALLVVLSVAYYTKGLYHLVDGTDFGDAGDLRLRWTEQRYFLQGQNPLDVWMRHAPMAKRSSLALPERSRNATVDSELGIKDPAHPPWGFIAGLLFLWPDWPAVRWYYALLNLTSGLLIGCWAFRMGQPYGPGAACLLASAGLAIGGATTALEVGQYTIVVTGLLVASLWFDECNLTVLSGLCLALAMVKPTIAGPFLFAFLTRKRLVTLAVAAGYMAAASGIAWIVISTNPLEMLQQLLTVGAIISEGGTIGPITFLLASGINPRVATLVTMAIVAIPAILLMRSSRVRAPLTSFAIAAVAGRLWTYHRYYDDMMLIFLVVALGVLALQHQSRRLLWVAFLTVGVSVWAPGRAAVLPTFQVVQIFTWFVGLAILRSIPPQPTGQTIALSRRWEGVHTGSLLRSSTR